MARIYFLAYLLAFFAVTLTTAQRPSPVVHTKSGTLRGRLIELSPVLQVYEFTGIPYAEPPVGKLRFRKTVSKSSWGDNTLDATSIPNACPQIPMGAGIPSAANFSGSKAYNPKGRPSEDCLFLNIWVPKAMLDALSTTTDEPPKTLAVFTFIHGGGFSTGATSNDLFNGAILAALNNVIVTTMQYRLGSLGFAYYGTEEAPGNMGLWDQMEALKWQCENIGSFGGNCSETTIAGESAGAVSVTYHLLSPNSRKYFKRAIIESGSALSPWAWHTPEVATQVTDIVFQQIASRQCNQSGSLTLKSSVAQKLACLRSADFSTFPMADVVPAVMGFGFLPFVPVVDGDFLKQEPGQMLRDGHFYKVPLLIGANKDEGSLFLLMNPDAMSMLPMPTMPEQSLEDLNFTHYNLLLNAGIRGNGGNLVHTDSMMFDAVQLHYWPQRSPGFPTGQDVVRAAVAATGDYSLMCPTYNWAQAAANFPTVGSRTFVYYFSQRRSGHFWPTWMGVMHGDELPFVFGEPFAPYAKDFGYSHDDKILSRIMMAFWTNFVKYGDPNVRDVETLNIASGPLQQRPWPPFVGEECEDQFVEMNSLVQVYNYGPISICGLKSRDCLFWEKFFPKLYNVLSNAGEPLK